MAIFRTLVRPRTVKVVFLSEAKILSSDFTFIVNIISQFVVCTLLLSFWFNVWNIIHSIIDTILMLSFNIFVDRLEVKHFVRNWKRDKSNFAFSESALCNDWFLLFCLLFLLYVFCFTFCCHVYQMIEINDKMNQLPDDCPLAWKLKLWKWT